MARIPQIRRLVIEDFQVAKKWIGPLFQILNVFMEAVVSAFNKNLTIKDNLAADIKTVTLTSPPSDSSPAAVSWSLASPPIALLIGNVTRVDGGLLTIVTTAVQVQWRFGPSGLQLTKVVGITPSSTDQYTLTILAFTG